jgi:hypothetical protein
MTWAFKQVLPPSEKIVLLALADYAADDGSQIFPSLERLAFKSSLSERQVRRILRLLEAKAIIMQTGRHIWNNRQDRATNEYALQMPFDERADNMSPRYLNGATPETERGDNLSGRSSNGGTPRVERGDIQGQNGGTRMSPDPSSEIRQRDPSSTVHEVCHSVPVPDPDLITVESLVEGWNEIVAVEDGMTRVTQISPSRRQKILARIREHPSDDWWSTTLTNLSESPFLKGLTKSRDGRHWKATFDWLMANDLNCLKVHEGAY